MPILSVCVVAWLLSNMTQDEALGLVVLLVFGGVLYLGARLVRSRQR